MRRILIILIIAYTTTLMNSQDIVEDIVDIKVQCDPITGLCTIPDFEAEEQVVDWKEGEEIIYVGDPMCSGCWGISPELNALQRYGAELGVPFSLIMGGLRPGGGQAWDDEFKGYLKHHWGEVNKRSGQPFAYDLFERTSFDYNTEPACRGLVTARTIAPEKALTFYELTQHHFYVQSGDPASVTFYEPICAKLSIDFALFSDMFQSEEMKQKTAEDFGQSRQWGVRAFPSIVYRKDNQLYLIAQGYATYEDLKNRIVEIRNGQVSSN